MLTSFFHEHALAARRHLPLLSVLLVGQPECPSPEPVPPYPGTHLISAGRSIGPARVGASYRELAARLGEAQGFGANNVLLARYPGEALEVVFSVPDATLTDDARVIAVGALAGGDFTGSARPGQTRAAIEAALGAPADAVGNTAFYTSGLGISYDPSGIAQTVAVFASYPGMTSAPEMMPARTLGWQRPEVDASRWRAVDMHLHPGQFGRIPALTKQFIVGAVPPFLQVYAPGVTQLGLAPYAPHLGIKTQTDVAGIDHAVLFAVYTQRTTGFVTNEEVEAMLADPRNRAADGLPWAFGLASINFFDGYIDERGLADERVARSRVGALASYFERRPDLFIGIKLAHAHQGVTFDDPRYLGVYDVAAEHGVPVYLHTGFTPFPQGQNTPAHYDPEGLENTIANLPEVEFILGHVGQGDLRAVEHALALAETHANVYLEISALGRPAALDEDGHPLAASDPRATAPQLPRVLAEIKRRNLVHKTLFGSDGPQAAGTVQRYTELVTRALADAQFTDDEVHQVMAANFARVFFE
jgi:predicted TIM-barrel fold metal-dependent hydrolase